MSFEASLAKRLFGVAFLTVILGSSSAFAQSGPTSLGAFGDWQAFQAGEGKTKSCFAISRPKSRKPDGLKRDPATFFITHRPGQGIRNEVSVIAGFPMKEAMDARLAVGETGWAMFTKDESAWVKTAAEEPVVLAAMRKGATATFEGTSRRGNKTTDSYSLKGLSDALTAISAACK